MADESIRELPVNWRLRWWARPALRCLCLLPSRIVPTESAAAFIARYGVKYSFGDGKPKGHVPPRPLPKRREII